MRPLKSIEAGLTYTGAESLSDKVLTILKHPETSAFNFQGAFNKYRGKFTEYSSVEIKAINVPDSYAKGTIRISLGKDNTIEEAKIIGETLVSVLMEQK